jgi:hypothetical protein
MKTVRIVAISLAAAAGALPAAAQTISACVHEATGDVRIVAPGTTCPRNSSPLEWNQPVQIPPPPQLHVQYIMSVGPGFARAFCPPSWKVTGGGGFSVDNTPLAQNHPISTTDGVNAHDGNAIGWQVASAVPGEFLPQVQTFVVCALVF